MPRKTDGIEFELHPSPQKDKDGKPLLYVKLASKKKLTFAQLESYSISHKHMAKGEHPRLRRVKNGKSYLYFPIQEESPVEK